VGDRALGQQGIAGNFLALNIDGIEEWNGGFDFVGSFEALVFLGQEAYFFWV
jgi:hypothetical protein